jgi:3-hydroxybutyryl-CoA dehydrogenase
MSVGRDANKPDLCVGVVGAGTMGRGIAQVAATGGCRVLLYDAKDGASQSAHEFVAGMLKRAVEKGRMEAADAEAATARIQIADAIPDLAPCDVVVEAIIEDMEIKQKVFAEIEAAIAPDAVLATNTSSLSVTRIASVCEHPERVAGFHFFNPVPLMPLVEVISGIKTEDWVTDFLLDLGNRMGRQPVRVADAPGFLVNQVGRGYTIEAAHLVSEGAGSFVDIDRIMRDLAGFRMGPFELLDLTALDVTHPATIEIYQQYYDEPRYRPSELMGVRLQAGLLGRKVGQGFYTYEDGKQVTPDEELVPSFDGGTFWLGAAEPDARDALAAIVEKAEGKIDAGNQPGLGSVILVTPLGEDATSVAAEHGLDATRTVAVDTLFGLDNRRVLMKTPVTTFEATTRAQAMLGADGTPVTILRDSPGFAAQRIVAMIVNIGASVAQKGIATPTDIDKAVKLGLNYPHGPLGFGDALGPARILRVLENMHRLYGDPRYRPSPWLRRRAQLGVSLLTPES